MPHWPKEYSGMDASVDQQLILQEEFGRASLQVLSRQAHSRPYSELDHASLNPKLKTVPPAEAQTPALPVRLSLPG